MKTDADGQLAFFCCGEILLLFVSNEGDPLSHIEELRFFSSLLFPSGTAVSPEGEATQGERPLDPRPLFSPFSQNFSLTF
jgi:hypothetical protein